MIFLFANIQNRLLTTTLFPILTARCQTSPSHDKSSSVLVLLLLLPLLLFLFSLLAPVLCTYTYLNIFPLTLSIQSFVYSWEHLRFFLCLDLLLSLRVFIASLLLRCLSLLLFLPFRR